ncbi:MAG TPA: adenylate/guanylate cyclase domain-containing protein [Burkholderiales bacterium]|nr:adenylate/guanylate cyclase domain-containing protein [Burkholderiales bacterium]
MEGSGRTLVCSVLFLDITEYSKKPVSEQLQLKQAFNHALSRALEQVAARDRIILDTGDGAAVTFMGDPEDALFASITMRDLAASFGVRMGVNLGPVRLVKDLNGQMNIIGDGINVAQRVMSFAAAGQLLVSRSFYEVVSCLSRDYAALFRHEGARTDKHVREHDVYSVVGGTPSARRLSDTITLEVQSDGAAGWLRGQGPLGLRRSALLAAPVAFLIMVAGGIGARALMADADAPLVKPAAVASSRPKPAVQAPPVKVAAPEPAPVAVTPADKPQTVAEKKPSPVTKLARPPAALGRVEFAVAPWGEIVIDGKSRGVSPPLRSLEIPVGPHTIEIRNTSFPAHVAKIEVKESSSITIRHRFR